MQRLVSIVHVHLQPHGEISLRVADRCRQAIQEHARAQGVKPAKEPPDVRTMDTCRLRGTTHATRPGRTAIAIVATRHGMSINRLILIPRMNKEPGGQLESINGSQSRVCHVKPREPPQLIIVRRLKRLSTPDEPKGTRLLMALEAMSVTALELSGSTLNDGLNLHVTVTEVDARSTGQEDAGQNFVCLGLFS